MDFLSLILFAIAAIFSAYVCKQNLNLAEQLAATESRLIDLESQRASTADFLNDLESRVSNAVKLSERSSSGQLGEIQAQVRNALETQLSSDLADFSKFKAQVDKELTQLGANFKMHQTDIGTLSKRQNDLINTALTSETNICVMSTREACPKGLTRIGTFGTILHTPSGQIGKGFYVNGEYTKGWDWYHGALCCKDVEAKTAGNP